MFFYAIERTCVSERETEWLAVRCTTTPQHSAAGGCDVVTRDSFLPFFLLLLVVVFVFFVSCIFFHSVRLICNVAAMIIIQ